MCNDTNRRDRAKVYDFRRPDKFSREQIHTMYIIHEGFARLAQTWLAMELRGPCGLKVASVDQLTWEEFIRSLPNPTCLGLLSLEPLGGPLAVEIDPWIYNTLLDRLCGLPLGACGSADREGREFGGLDEPALEWVLGRLGASLAEAWTNVAALKPRVEGLQSNPAFAQIVPPSEMIILVTLEARIGERQGMVNLAFPFLTIEPVIQRLSAAAFYQVPFLNRPGAGMPALIPGTVGAGRRVADAPVSLEIAADAEPLDMARLARLAPGDMIPVTGMDEGGVWLQECFPAAPRPSTLLALEPGARQTDSRYRLPLRLRDARRFLALEPSGRPRRGHLKWNASARVNDGFPEPLLSPRDNEELQEVDAATAGVEDLGHRMERALDALGSRLEGMQVRQEALADQLLYGGPAAPDRQAKGDDRPGMAGEPPVLAPEGLAWLRPDMVSVLGALVAEERPSMVAMVLSRLEPPTAARLLDAMDPVLRTLSVKDLMRLEGSHRSVQALVEARLASKFSRTAAPELPVDSVDRTAGILNLVVTGTERQIVEALEKSDPELAEELKRRLFVFEDIVILDPRCLEEVLRRADPEDLALAMKSVDPDLEALVQSRMDPEAWKDCVQRRDALGTVRLKDVEAARQRVVETIRDMETRGLIRVIHPDEQVL